MGGGGFLGRMINKTNIVTRTFENKFYAIYVQFYNSKLVLARGTHACKPVPVDIPATQALMFEELATVAFGGERGER